MSPRSSSREIKVKAGFELESTTEKKRPYELRARTFARKIQDMATAFPK